MLKCIVAVILLFSTVLGKAQSAIQTDRPDQTESPFVVPKGFIQIESGLGYENIGKENKYITHPTVLWKYGMSKTFELRLITNFSTEKNKDIKINGITPVTVGFKVNISEEKGLLPLTSFIGHLVLPSFASKKFKVDYFAPAFRFTMQHTLSKKVTLSYNIGAEWDGFTAEPAFIYTLTAGYSITDKIGSYAEVYGFLPQKNKADHRTDAGFTYFLSNNMMVDLSGGVRLNSIAPKSYVALGFSFRFNTRKA
jgi:hypothetical protein